MVRNMNLNDNPITSQRCHSFSVDIFIAGDRRAATEACREFCLRGLCVSITEADFVFTGGLESGVRVGLINYPRFPSDGASLTQTAINLAHHLIGRLHQSSCSIVTPDETIWLSRRP